MRFDILLLLTIIYLPLLRCLNRYNWVVVQQYKFGLG